MSRVSFTTRLSPKLRQTAKVIESGSSHDSIEETVDVDSETREEIKGSAAFFFGLGLRAFATPGCAYGFHVSSIAASTSAGDNRRR